MAAECARPDCPTAAIAKGLCPKHYAQVRRGGSDRVPYRDDPTKPRCPVPGCPRPSRRKSGLCGAHYEHQRKHGSVDAPPGRAGRAEVEVPTYNSMHGRLRRILGSATKQRCVDCGGPARDWSLSKSATNTLVGENGFLYSLSFEDYEPRCKKCHLAYDASSTLP